MSLAAVLKYDGEETYQYRHIVASDPYTAQDEITKLAADNFHYRKTFWFTDGVKDAPACVKDNIYDQALCESGRRQNIRVGSLALMECGNGKRAKKQYRVLSGGAKIFIWERSTTTSNFINF